MRELTLTKEQKRISGHFHCLANLHFFGSRTGKSGWCLHHKDESLREKDIERYIQWRIEDIVPMTRGEHATHHNIGNKYNQGHHLSEETKGKISQANRNNEVNSHEVTQYTLNGELIKTYPSSKEAERQTGVKSESIMRCCRGDSRCISAGKYVWRFGHDEKIDYVYDSGRKNNVLSKEVNQIGNDGTVIRVFKSTKDVERTTGISSASVSLCCNGIRKTAGGYHWSYASGD